MQLAKYIGNAQKIWVRGIQTRVDVTVSMLASMKVGMMASLLTVLLMTGSSSGSQNAWACGYIDQNGSKSTCEGVKIVEGLSETIMFPGASRYKFLATNSYRMYL